VKFPKLPPSVLKLTRQAISMGSANSISPETLQIMAHEERVVVIGLGLVQRGPLDDRLPGEQRAASLLSLKDTVADLPRQQAIVLHCG